MRTFKLLLTFITIMIRCLQSTPAAGQYSDPLFSYMAEAALHNPMLKARYNEYLAALEKVPQARSLPDPELSFGVFAKPMQLLMGDQLADIRLMQMFPWFGSLKAAKDEASLMAKMKYEQFNNAKLEVYYQVLSEYYSLYRIRKEVNLTEQSLGLLEHLEQNVLARYRSGQTGAIPESFPSHGTSTAVTNEPSGSSGMSMGTSINSGSSMVSGSPASMIEAERGMGGSGNSMTDVLRVRIEKTDTENKLLLLQDDQKTAQARFNSLLNRPAEDPVITSDTLTNSVLEADLVWLTDSLELNNPMLRMMESQQAMYKTQQRMAKKMGYPMIGIGVSYMPVRRRNDVTSMMNGQDMLMPMASITIPVHRKKYRAMKTEAFHMQQAAMEDSIDLGNRLRIELREAIQLYQDASRQILLNNRQSDITEKMLNLLMVSYTVTGKGFDEILRIRQQLLDYKINEITAFTDQLTAVAHIKRLTGNPFTSNQ